MHKPIRVLFVCDGGPARSRMAEALLRSKGGDRFDVHSAGIELESLNTLAVEVMAELGIDLETGDIAALNDFEGMQFDYVISLCDEVKSSCLAFARDIHNLHWDCADPTIVEGDVEQQRAAYRNARDTLEQHVQSWLDSLS